MKTTFGKFRGDESGYVTALALISMPLLLGLSLLVIDASRANNLHTDLQNAVDAIALAGARELNGGPDSITRAEAAMTDLLQNQARMGDNGTIAIDADQVDWLFFEDIPANDDDAMDPEDATTDPFLAAYVWVWSSEQPMTSLFPLPVSLASATVTVQADAVATYDVGACDVTPLFVCNPFEGDVKTLQENFAEGKLYSRQLILNFNGSTTPGPGNFGWLQTASPGGNALRDALASGKPGICYSIDGLTTKTGGTIGPAEQGANVRFGIYAGGMSASAEENRPAINIRKGAKTPSNCNNYEEETDTSQAMAFPSASISGGTYGTVALQGGGSLSGDNWLLVGDEANPGYWDVNHPGEDPPTQRTTDPAGGTGTPSRYDVYQYEIANDLIDDAAPNGETGNAEACFTGDDTKITAEPDRRVIFAAVVDCQATTFTGQTTFTAPTAFVSMFMTKPMITSGSTKQLYVEIIDISGNSGNGTLETLIREEASLVR
jgi:hypothetical protein